MKSKKEDEKPQNETSINNKKKGIPPPIKVCVIDDDKSYRAYLRIVFEENKNLKLYAEYDSGTAFLKDIGNPFKADVYLVDVVLKDMSGIECAKVIKSKKPSVHVVIMTAYPDESSFIEARKLGADYIEKGPRIETLLTGLIETKGLGSKERIISLQGKDRLRFEHLEMAYEFDNVKKRIKELTAAQQRVIQLKREGKSFKQIAKEMKICEGTVRTHLSRALKQLQLPDILGYLFEE